ncbi:peptide deformylase [Candidatus Woesearchaeota archaeon]|nr:peptide deformylase [Candidatus Woesearchaeota archaeon]
MLTSIFWDEDILRRPAKQVMYLPQIWPVVDHLRRALDDYGLAAITPQNVLPPEGSSIDDYLLSVMIVRGTLDEDLVLVNPEIWGQPQLVRYEECGSIETDERSAFGVILKRPQRVHVKAYLLSGDLYKGILEGDNAAYAMHEFDHLHGKMIVDRVHDISKVLKSRVEDGLTCSLFKDSEAYIVEVGDHAQAMFCFDYIGDTDLFTHTIGGKKVLPSRKMERYL